MISICAPTFDIDGQLTNASGWAEAQNISRRASRVATLDGGAVLVDSGSSVADLTYKLKLPDPDGEDHLTLTAMIRNHPSAILSCDRSCYQVLLSSLAYKSGNTTCTAEVLAEI